VSLLAPTRHPFSHPVSDLAKLPLADRLAETRGRVEPGDHRGAPDREGQDSGTVASIRAMSASSWATRSMPFYAPEFVGHHPGARGRRALFRGRAPHGHRDRGRTTALLAGPTANQATDHPSGQNLVRYSDGSTGVCPPRPRQVPPAQRHPGGVRARHGECGCATHTACGSHSGTNV